MNSTEQFVHDYENAEPDKRDEMLRAFLLTPVEPKSALPVGVWHEGESVWGYRGTLSVVIQFAKPAPDMNASEPMCLSRCPPCERRDLMMKYPSRKVKRWLILPP